MRSAGRIGSIDEPGSQSDWGIGAIEFVVGFWIDDDPHMRAAAAGASGHLLACRGKGPIVGAADENKSWHPRAPGALQKAAATRVKGRRGAEIGRVVMDRGG